MDFSNYAYTVVEGQDLSGQTIDVDGKYFTGCNLVGAQFFWRGEAPYAYAGCTTDGLQLILAGHAEMVVRTITAMFGIEGLIKLGYSTIENAPKPTKN